MAVIPFDPVMQLLSTERPHIDKVSLGLVAAAHADLLRLHELERDPVRRAHLGAVAEVLQSAIDRHAPEGGA